MTRRLPDPTRFRLPVKRSRLAFAQVGPRVHSGQAHRCRTNVAFAQREFKRLSSESDRRNVFHAQGRSNRRADDLHCDAVRLVAIDSSKKRPRGEFLKNDLFCLAHTCRLRHIDDVASNPIASKHGGIFWLLAVNDRQERLSLRESWRLFMGSVPVRARCPESLKPSRGAGRGWDRTGRRGRGRTGCRLGVPWWGARGDGAAAPVCPACAPSCCHGKRKHYGDPPDRFGGHGKECSHAGRPLELEVTNDPTAYRRRRAVPPSPRSLHSASPTVDGFRPRVLHVFARRSYVRLGSGEPGKWITRPYLTAVLPD